MSVLTGAGYMKLSTAERSVKVLVLGFLCYTGKVFTCAGVLHLLSPCSVCCSHAGAVEHLLPTMRLVGFLLLGGGERPFPAAGPGRPSCSQLHTDLLSVPAALCFSPPAPEHLAIHSVNFNHTLSWNAGGSTPVGTRYLVYSING